MAFIYSTNGTSDIASSGSATAGRLGLGTSTPATNLHVKTAGSNSVNYAIEVQNPNGTDTGGTATGMLFSTESLYDYGKGALVYERANSFARGKFHFLQNSAADANSPSLSNTVMTITNSGSVGIGTSSPSAKLQVVGDVSITGNISLSNNLSANEITADEIVVTRGVATTEFFGISLRAINKLVLGFDDGAGPIITYGDGAPTDNTPAKGSLYLRQDGSTTTTLYVKTGATTWTAK